MDEAAYDDALIDEFDGPALLLERPPPPAPHPLVSAQSLRHCGTSSASIAVAAPPAADHDRDRNDTVQPVMYAPVAHGNALYPSFDALSVSSSKSSSAMVPHVATSPLASADYQFHQQRLQNEQLHQHPERPLSYDTVAPTSIYPNTLTRTSMYSNTLAPQRHSVEPFYKPRPPSPQQQQQHTEPITRAVPSPQQHQPSPAQPPHYDSLYKPHEPAQEPQPGHTSLPSPPPPLPSPAEIESKQRALERELAGYEQQLDYLAHALAGDTPHQIAERKRREREREVRDAQRMAATELRVAHQIERLHERELRRAKTTVRSAKAAESPSRDAEDSDDSDVGSSDEQDDGNIAVEPATIA